MVAAVFDLEPMSIGDIIDRSIRLYRSHFFHAVAIAAVPYLVNSALWTGTDAFVDRPGGWEALRDPVVVVREVVLLLFGGWLGAVEIAAMAASVAAWYRGQVPSLWTSYRLALRRFPVLIWGALSLMAFDFPARAVTLVLDAWSMEGVSPPMFVAYVVGVLAATIPLSLLLLRFILVPHLTVLDGLPGPPALRRSWRLMRGQVLRAFVIVLLWMFLFVALWSVATLPAYIIPGWGPGLEQR